MNQFNEKRRQGPPRVFGVFELMFDFTYLVIAFLFGILIIKKGSSILQVMAALMTFLLAVGDSFHLVPRMASIIRGENEALKKPWE